MKKSSVKFFRIPSGRLLLTTLWLLGASMFAFVSPVMSQTGSKSKSAESTARGIVVDQAGKPLAGVAIVIKGTNIGTATDPYGRYELDLNNPKNVILVYSLLGMRPIELPYKNSQSIKVVMEEAVESVDAVVVTGYQRIDKRYLSSSISSISASDLIGGGIQTLDNMLQGRLPGVSVSGVTGTPGAAPKIRIRGQSSITGNREPVWVLDGVILNEPVSIPAEELNNPDKVNLIGNAISFVNPEDIERVDILKDASATAIYGVKAANGVIVVTTKKGKRGTPVVNYTATLSVKAAPTYDKMFLMNSNERIEMSQEMQERGLEFGSYKPTDVGYEGVLAQLWDKQIDYNQFLVEVQKLKNMNTNWYDELFKTSFSHQHSLSVSGGTDKSDYYFSVGYANDNSVTRGEKIDRYNAMIKVNTKFNDKVRAGFKLSGSLAQTDRPHKSIDLYEYAFSTSRAIPLYNEDGSLAYYTRERGAKGNIPFNMINELNHTGADSDNSNLSMTVDLDWNIAKWVRYSTVIGLSRNTNAQSNWVDDQSFYASNLRGIAYGQKIPLPSEDADFAQRYCSLPFGGVLDNDNTRNTTYTWRNNLLLFHKFGKHDLSANLGQEVNSSKYDGLKSVQFGYLPDRGKRFVDIDPMLWPKYSTMLRQNPDVVTDTKNNVLSYYGTAAYVYDDRYVFNFNIRADGSNKFGQDRSVRFLPVWSVSGRWNIANEKFFSSLTDVINDISVRGSYGIQGNVHPDQTPNLIASLGSLDGMTQEYISTLYKFPNTKLRWEKTRSYNAAVDLSMWNNRLYGSLEYYYKKGVDQVVSKNVAPSTGAANVSINDGDVENKGWDLAVSVVPIQTKQWMWSISFNTGKNYNKVLNAGNAQSITWGDYIAGTLVSNGTALNSFYSYQFDKLDSNGLPTFKNFDEKDKDNNMLSASQQEAFDRIFVISGQRIADLTGGFSSYVRFKNFTLNALFTFSFGSKLRLNNLYESSGQQLPYPNQNMSSEFVNRWRQPGDELHTNIPALSDKALTVSDIDRQLWGSRYERKYAIANNLWDMYNNSDIRVVSGNYLRCRSLSIRYDFDPKMMKKIYMKGASVTFDIGNVFVLKDKALKGRDPEQLELGSRTLPPQRTYSLRLNLTF